MSSSPLPCYIFTDVVPCFNHHLCIASGVRVLFAVRKYCTVGNTLLMQGCTADQCATPQVGFWDGSVAVVRLQPGTAPPPSTPVALQGQGAAPACKSADRALQHDMVLLVHFQVDATALRAVAWCSPQVICIPPPQILPPTPPHNLTFSCCCTRYWPWAEKAAAS